MNKTRQKMSFAQFYQKFGTLLILIAVFAVASVLSPKFLSQANLTNVLRQIVVISVIGCGSCFILISGNINIAYDGLIALLGCISCIIMTRTQNLFLAVLLTVILGALIGYLYGICVTTFKIPGFITGLAFNSVASGTILLITGGVAVSYTGLGNFNVLGQGYIGQRYSTSPLRKGNFNVLGQGYIGPVPICVIILLAILIGCHILLSQSCFGRKVYAVGGNRVAAATSGINANRVVRQIFILDGITCAIGSIIFMSRMNSGQPTGGAGYAFDAITAVCVGGVSISGGTGGVLGTLVGAAIVGIINNLLNLRNVDSNWQKVVSGCIILVAVTIDILVKNSLRKK